jgi:GNAT superfamily N-acetyltransferase
MTERSGLRLMTPQDIPFGMRLKEEAGWNQTSEDWELFLALRPEGCFVALDEGVPAGTVTTLDHGGTCGWIGMLLVDRRRRRRGLGTRLLEAAVLSLERVETVKLDATPQGKLVYDRLGFRDECLLSRLIIRGAATPVEDPASGVRPPSAGDLAAVAAFDAEAFGAPRPRLLEALFRRAPELASLREGPSGVLGYSLGRRGSACDHIGPLVARDLETAQCLVLRALARRSGRPALIDAFRGNGRWLAFLESLGFAQERGFTRMHRGPNRFPGRPELQWAAAGPELG